MSAQKRKKLPKTIPTSKASLADRVGVHEKPKAQSEYGIFFTSDELRELFNWHVEIDLKKRGKHGESAAAKIAELWDTYKLYGS